MNFKKSGYLVKHTDGRIGRTYHDKPPINNKVCVYFADKMSTPTEDGFTFPLNYLEKASLVSPENLTQIGFID